MVSATRAMMVGWEGCGGGSDESAVQKFEFPWNIGLGDLNKAGGQAHQAEKMKKKGWHDVSSESRALDHSDLSALLDE
jgi:hypothetical protein